LGPGQLGDSGDKLWNRSDRIGDKVGVLVLLVAAHRRGRLPPSRCAAPRSAVALLEAGAVHRRIGTHTHSTKMNRCPAAAVIARHRWRAGLGAAHSRIAGWPSSSCRASSTV